MKKKICLTVVLFIICVMFNIKGVFATNYSNKYVSIDIPKSIEKSYSNVDDDSAWESFYRYEKGAIAYTMVHYDVYKRSQYASKEYTKSYLDQMVEILKNTIEKNGDSCIFYHKDLIELNGCKGMRIAYKQYDKSLNQSSYIDEYFLLSDNREYYLNIESTLSTYIDSKEEKEIVNSFKIKDTVKLSRGISFVDVPSNAWYNSAVKYVEDKKIITGINAYTFAPGQKLTRGMLVTILHRMEGMPNVSGKSKFPDVQDSKQFYYTAVKWATSKKIVSGYNNGKFGPDDPITREQLAVMLNNYCNYKGKYKSVSGNLSAFKDSSKINSYAKYAVNWAVGNKIITGDQGKINPQGNATRAEAASMIYKYCLNIGR